jgi:arginine/lysine/ornithine decarboxylase
VEQVKALETETAEREKAQQAEVSVTEAAVPMRTVFYGKKKTVPLSGAVGLICAEPISFYPPGIPVILPGERFTDKIVAWCCLMKQQGLPVSGPADTSLQTVRVLTQE